MTMVTHAEWKQVKQTDVFFKNACCSLPQEIFKKRDLIYPSFTECLRVKEKGVLLNFSFERG